MFFIYVLYLSLDIMPFGYNQILLYIHIIIYQYYNSGMLMYNYINMLLLIYSIYYVNINIKCALHVMYYT